MSRDSTFVSSPPADSDLNGPLGDLKYPFAPGPILTPKIRGAPSPSPPSPVAPAHPVHPLPNLTPIPSLDIPQSQRKQGAMFKFMARLLADSFIYI